MIHKYLVIAPLILVLLSLSSCGLASQSPEAVYEEFKRSCDSGDIATAKSLATEDALQENKTYGICILMPDGMDRVLGTSIYEFDIEEPETEIKGNTAYLTWRTINDHEVQMVMYKIDGRWKVQRSIIF